MKINIKDIVVEKDKVSIEGESYDKFSNLIETKEEKYQKVYPAGSILNYEGTYILLLSGDEFLSLGYNESVNVRSLDYDWGSDPRVIEVIKPFKNMKELEAWTLENPECKQDINRHYKKSFFKA